MNRAPRRRCPQPPLDWVSDLRHPGAKRSASRFGPKAGSPRAGRAETSPAKAPPLLRQRVRGAARRVRKEPGSRSGRRSTSRRHSLVLLRTPKALAGELVFQPPLEPLRFALFLLGNALRE